MLSELKFTLIADGSSDKTLISIIKWLLDDLYPEMPSNGAFADFRHLRNPPKKSEVAAQIKLASKFYPFDILFYHRDAESKESGILKIRTNEILNGVKKEVSSKVVSVIPITMMETWLLIDQEAIKKAAGNRNYSGTIPLPPVKSLETITNPKDQLHRTLKQVSGLKGRNLKKFNVHQAVHFVAENIEDFSPLRNTSAFKAFEDDLKKKIKILKDETANE